VHQTRPRQGTRHSAACFGTHLAVIQHLGEIVVFLNYCFFSGSAEAIVRYGGKLQHLLIQGRLSPRGHGAFPQNGLMPPPQFLIIMHL